jgi:hypothetical protein
MSAVDVTVPAYGDPTTQSVRDNFVIIQQEVGDLQAAIPTLIPLDGSRAMTGLLTLSGNPSGALHAVPRQYADAIRTASLPLVGGIMQGPLILQGDPTDPLGAATRQFVLANAGSGGDFLPLTGGTISGVLQVGAWVQPATAPVTGSIVADFVSLSGLLGNYLFNATVDQSGTGVWRYMTDGPAAAMSINDQGDVGFYVAQPGVAGALLTFGPTLIIGGQGDLGIINRVPANAFSPSVRIGGPILLDAVGTLDAGGSGDILFNSYYDDAYNYYYLADGVAIDMGFGLAGPLIINWALSGTAGAPCSFDNGGLVIQPGGIIYAGAGYQPGGGLWLDTLAPLQLRKNVAAYTAGLDEVVQLRAVTYQSNGLGITNDDGHRFHALGADDGRTYFGLVTEEAQPVMPEMFGTMRGKMRRSDSAEIDITTMNATPLIYALLNSVQTLHARVVALEAQRG